MKMNQHATRVLALAAFGLLAACGGGGNGGDPAHFSGKNDSMASRISNARTLEESTTFRAEAVGINLGEENELVDGEDIAFRIFRTSPDVAPTFVVTHNEETTTFGPEHLGAQVELPNNYFIEDLGDNNDKWLWTWAGRPLELADGRYWGGWTEGRYIPSDWKHHFPVNIYYNGDPTDLRRIAVIGLETAPGDMPTHDVRARYSGRVSMQTFPADSGPFRDFLGDIALIAHFSEGTIGGFSDNWRVWNEGWQDLPALSYTLADAPINGNGFTTSVASCAGCDVQVVDSTVAGKFYGPYADEAGGTIQAEFSDGAVAIGAFYTDQD